MIDIAAALAVLIGAFFSLIAAIGMLRMPDLYVRMHAGSKAGTLGAGLMLLAVALVSGAPGVVLRALAAIVFLVLTAPIAAHLLARAAYIARVHPWSGTRFDEMAGLYERETGTLRAAPRLSWPAAEPGLPHGHDSRANETGSGSGSGPGAKSTG